MNDTPRHKRPLCKMCGSNLAECNGRSKTTGKYMYQPFCTSCIKNPYQIHKGDSCEVCGFVPVHPVQLDVDHIDGNHYNNDVNNLQTLCANCHRLKTHMNLDQVKKEDHELETFELQQELEL